VIERKTMELSFNFNNNTEAESVIKFNGHYIEILGEFGEVTFKKESE